MNLYICVIVCDACKVINVRSVGEEHVEDGIDFARDQAKKAGWSHGTGGWFCPGCIERSIGQFKERAKS